jgi:hypothetical protein
MTTKRVLLSIAKGLGVGIAIIPVGAVLAGDRIVKAFKGYPEDVLDTSIEVVDAVEEGAWSAHDTIKAKLDPLPSVSGASQSWVGRNGETEKVPGQSKKKEVQVSMADYFYFIAVLFGTIVLAKTSVWLAIAWIVSFTAFAAIYMVIDKKSSPVEAAS